MGITMTRMGSAALLGFTLLGLGSMAACLSDDGATEEETGGTGGSDEGTGGAAGGAGPSSGGDAGSSASGGTGNAPPGNTACAAPIVISSATPGIADFEDYDGGADLGTWSFALGGDSSTGVFAGTFIYGDEATGFPETYSMVEGNDSTYAFSISDTLAEEYGGGMGLWLSDCVDLTAFSGISFWVRGNAPTGQAKLSLLMEETTPAADGETVGTCDGTIETCLHPSYMFDVSDTWTQVTVNWAEFLEGDAAGTAVTADGHNIWQLQFDIPVAWVPDDAGDYQPVPAPYELVVDDMTLF